MAPETGSRASPHILTTVYNAITIKITSNVSLNSNDRASSTEITLLIEAIRRLHTTPDVI